MDRTSVFAPHRKENIPWYTMKCSGNTTKSGKTESIKRYNGNIRRYTFVNRIAELRKKLGLTQTRLGEELGVSQQTISKYENAEENISGDMLLALSKFFKVPVDYILRRDEEEIRQEQNDRKEIMELYKDLDQYNRDTWIIIGKRLLGGQLHKYNENEILGKNSKRY